MKAIILAAGVARRLYPSTFEIPKCLLKIKERPILDYQLEAIQSLKVTDVLVVVGYHRDKIISHLDESFPKLNFSFMHNEHFFETNTAYSLYLCRDIMPESDVLLMNGDVLYPVELLRRIMSSSYENVMAVEVKECGREEVKVIAGSDSRVVAIGKELIQENSLGEFIGVARFSSRFNEEFSRSLGSLIEAGGKADYFEAAIQPLLSRREVYYLDISDLPCIEIDFKEDLERASELATSEFYRT